MPSGFIDRPECESLFEHATSHRDGNPILMLRSDAVPGGTGKTTLARALAARLRSESLFSGHHLLVELRGAQQFTGDDRAKAIRLAKMSVIESCNDVAVDATMSDSDVNREYIRALSSKVGLLLIDDACHEDDVRALLLLDEKTVLSSSSSSSQIRSMCAIVTTRS